MAKKIVVLGDSLSAQQNLLEGAWPDLLQTTMRASGEDVTVVNLANNGYTFGAAMNSVTYGPLTPAQKCVAEAPDLIIIALGYNDSHLNASLPEVETQVATLLSYLKTNLPAVKIIYASQTPYDKVHGSPSTLLNRQALPMYFNRARPDLFNDLYCSENLGSPAVAGFQAAMGRWQSIDSYVKGRPQVDGSYEFPLWHCARLGLLGTDGLHLTNVGHKMMAGAARSAMYALPAAKSLFPQLNTQGATKWNDWKLFFDAVLKSNGTEFVTQALEPGDVHFMHYYGPWNAVLADTWYLPTHATHNVSTPNYIRDGAQVWTVTGATPNANVYTSLNGGTWSLHPRKTDIRGNYLDAGSFDDFPDGTYALRYRVGNEVFPVVNVTVSGAARAKADGSNATGVWPIQIAGPNAMQRQGLFTKRSMATGVNFANATREPMVMTDVTALGLLTAADIARDGKLYGGCRLSPAATADSWVRVGLRGTLVANGAGKLVWFGLYVANSSGGIVNEMVVGGTYSSPRPAEIASLTGETVVKIAPGQYIAPWIYVVDGGFSLSDGVPGNFWEFTANVIY